MEEHVNEMMAACPGTEQLIIEGVGQPGYGVPVAGVSAGKGPADVLQSEA